LLSFFSEVKKTVFLKGGAAWYPKIRMTMKQSATRVNKFAGNLKNAVVNLADPKSQIWEYAELPQIMHWMVFMAASQREEHDGS